MRPLMLKINKPKRKPNLKNNKKKKIKLEIYKKNQIKIKPVLNLNKKKKKMNQLSEIIILILV
jgi:hypothetical protein